MTNYTVRFMAAHREQSLEDLCRIIRATRSVCTAFGDLVGSQESEIVLFLFCLKMYMCYHFVCYRLYEEFVSVTLE